MSIGVFISGLNGAGRLKDAVIFKEF